MIFTRGNSAPIVGYVDRLNTQQLLVLLVGISVVIKISIWARSPVITSDGPVYIAQAMEFLRGNWGKGLALNGNLFFYPLLIAILGRLGMDLFVAGRLLSLVFSVTTVVPLFLLTRRLFDLRTAWWAALAFAVSPALNDYSVYVMRDPGFLFVFAWSVYFALQAISDKSFKSFLFAMFFAFLSFLFRMEGFFFPILLSLFLVGEGLLRRTWRSPFFKKIMVFLIVTMLGVGVASWVFTNNLLGFNRLGVIVSMLKTPLNKGVFSYDPQVEIQLKKMEKTLPRGEVDNDFAEIARENIRLIYFIGLIANLKQVIYPVFFVFCLGGLVLFRKYHASHALLLWLSGSYLFILYLYLLHRFFIETRYIYIPVFLLMPWVGYGIERGVAFLRKSSCFPRFVPLVMILVLFVLPGVDAAINVKRQFIAAKLAGEWLSDHPSVNRGPMLANRREMPFYAGRGMNFIFTERVEPEYLVSLARKRKIQLVTILTPNAAPAELQIDDFLLVKKFTDRHYDCYIFRRSNHELPRD